MSTPPPSKHADFTARNSGPVEETEAGYLVVFPEPWYRPWAAEMRKQGYGKPDSPPPFREMRLLAAESAETCFEFEEPTITERGFLATVTVWRTHPYEEPFTLRVDLLSLTDRQRLGALLRNSFGAYNREDWEGRVHFACQAVRDHLRQRDHSILLQDAVTEPTRTIERSPASQTRNPCSKLTYDEKQSDSP